VEGLGRSRTKLLNYSQLSLVTQGPEETPLAFLERLREALTKHTSMTSDFYEGQLILRDKSALNIQENLQKIPLGPENTF
jgi:hypothetical protein